MSHSDPIKLNCDILSAVTNIVADEQRNGFRSIISAITRTCKRMHLEGTNYLLAGTVELLSEDIPSFCLFMLASPSVRLPFLKSLLLRLHDIENGIDHVGPFCEVLQGSSNLHTLDVAFSANSPRAIVGQIAAVIPTLPSLRVLRVAEDGSVAGNTNADAYQIFDTALRKSRAPLVSLSLDLPDYDVDAGVGYSRRRDPLYLSSQHRTTLERLELNGGLNLIVRPGRAYEYPRLRKLILPMYRTFMPYMKPFIVSAPHLRDIQFGGPYDSHTRHRHDEDILRGLIVNATQTPQDCRATNQRDQEGSGHSWPMLDSFKGTVIGAYATGLACPVARVHLLSTGGRRATELAMLSVVLSDWRPSFLRLATDIYRARGYIPLLPSASTGWGESLETLELRLNIIEDRFDFEECFNHIAETLSTLPATSLHLEFRCVNSRTQHDGETRYPPVEPFEGDECGSHGVNGADAACHMQDELWRHDLPQRVRECVRSALALRRMTLAWGGCQTGGADRVICVDLDNAEVNWTGGRSPTGSGKEGLRRCEGTDVQALLPVGEVTAALT